MSAIASFALECARSGRWARGLLALQSNVASDDLNIRRACTALSLSAAPHNWTAALQVLKAQDACTHTESVGKALDAVAHNFSRPEHIFCRYVLRLLDDVGLSERPIVSQNHIFLCATKWCSWATAMQLYQSLAQPCDLCIQRLIDRTRLRDYSRDECGWGTTLGNSGILGGLAPWLEPTGMTHKRPVDVRGDSARLEEWRRKKIAAQGAYDLQRALHSIFAPSPTVESIGAALRFAAMLSSHDGRTQLQGAVHIPWCTALSLISKLPLTPELVRPYLRLVGFRAPSLWRDALRVVMNFTGGDEDEPRACGLLQLWVASRWSWEAGIRLVTPLVQQFGMSSSACRVAEDILSRTAVPPRILHHLFPTPTRPSIRLREPTRRALAETLAQGVPLNDIQLSVMAKVWSRGGRWRESLSLYQRLPNPEFQRRAVQSLLFARAAGVNPTRPCGGAPVVPPASVSACVHSVVDMAHLLQCDSHMPPLGAHSSAALIWAADNWSEGLSVFRHSVRHGTRCSSPMLLAILDQGPPSSVAQALTRSYPAAVNEKVLQRLRERHSDDEVSGR